MLILSGSDTIDMRSRTSRAMRLRPTENWLAISSPTERTRRLPRWSMSSVSPRPSCSSTSCHRMASTSCAVSAVIPAGGTVYPSASNAGASRWLIL